MADTVRVWDAWDREISGTVDAWDTWEKVKERKGFPGGLIAFLQTSTDSDGCGFERPTIVQAYAWPILQAGTDLVGVAKTGSGKTLAFLLPGFIKLRKLKKQGHIDTARGPALLTMTPTRELCYQIYSDAEKFGKPVSITAACAYGGAPKKDQEWAIRQGPDCLIATPGRLNDFLENRSVDLSQVRYAILDEADRMLDMGFEPQIRKVMDQMPAEDRQTAMFTATWPRECKKLAERYIKNPTQVQIGSDDITTNKNIRQHVEICNDDREKKSALKRILGYLGRGGTCLVFCNTKRKCRDLAWEMGNDRDLGLQAVELHGDLDQRQRDDALGRFRTGEARLCVATDVAARGLDIRNISTVVNFDAPNQAEDYVHRIGRTGRADDMGDAYTLLLSWGEDKKAAYIAQTMEKACQDVPQKLRDLAGGRGGGGGSSWGGDGGGGDSWKKDDDKKEDKWWEKSDKSDDKWKKDDDWKKDDWKKDDDWKKKDDDWKKDDWKKDDWKKDDWKKDDWKKDDDWKKQDDWKKDNGKDEGVSWQDASKDAKPEEPEDEADVIEELPKPGSLIDILGSKRPALDKPAEEPPEKRARGEEDLSEEEHAEEARSEKAPDEEMEGEKAREEDAHVDEARGEDGEPDAEMPDKEKEKEDNGEEAEAGDAEQQQDPDGVEALVQAGNGSRLKIADLKSWLEAHGLSTTGVKATLIERVQEHLAEKD